MNIADIKELSKNINIKGDLNSETLEKLSEKIAPKVLVFKIFQDITGSILSLFWGGVVIVVVSMICKACAPQ